MATKSEKALELAQEGGKRARAALKSVKQEAGAKIGQARKMLRESKHRRKIEAIEVGLGSLAAAAVHGVDLVVEYDDMSIPAGAPAGLVVMGAGMAMGEPDLEAVGFGGFIYGISRFAEDKIREWNNETDTDTEES